MTKRPRKSFWLDLLRKLKEGLPLKPLIKTMPPPCPVAGCSQFLGHAGPHDPPEGT